MKKIPPFIKIAFCIVWLGFALAVYLFHDDSSTQSAALWLGIGGFIVLLYLVVNWYRTKNHIE